MSKSEVKVSESMASLKGKVYCLTNKGKHCERYKDTTEAIAKYVGRVYGQEMYNLVLHGTETEFEEPTLEANPNELDKLKWSKMYDIYTKDMKNYEVNKFKVWIIIWDQCEKAMINRIESDDDCEELTQTVDVVGLLRLIKDIMFNKSDLMYRPLQAVTAWCDLARLYQGEKESCLDYYNRFIGQHEMVVRLYGEITPLRVAEEMKEFDTSKKAKNDEVIETASNAVLAALYLKGANRKRFSKYLKEFADDYARDKSSENIYPKTIEEALALMQDYEKRHRSAPKDRSDGEELNMSFAQVCCWYCKEEGHKRSDCEKYKQKLATDKQRVEDAAQQHMMPSWMQG